METISFRIEIHDLHARPIKRWGRGNASAPHWRMWWNDRPGAWVQIIDGPKHQLLPDRVVLIPPHTPICRQLTESVNYCNLHFSLGIPWDLVRGQVFSLRAPDGVKAIFGDATAADVTVSQFAVGELVMSCFRQIPAEIFEDFVFDERIEAAIDHLSSNRHRLVPNDELAELVHVTTNTFIRLFSTQTGISPQAFHQQMRLDRGAILLTQSTQMTMDEVAEATGFHDRHHFSKAFRKRYDCSPSAYRRLDRR